MVSSLVVRTEKMRTASMQVFQAGEAIEVPGELPPLALAGDEVTTEAVTIIRTHFEQYTAMMKAFVTALETTARNMSAAADLMQRADQNSLF